MYSLSPSAVFLTADNPHEGMVSCNVLLIDHGDEQEALPELHSDPHRNTILEAM